MTVDQLADLRRQAADYGRNANRQKAHNRKPGTSSRPLLHRRARRRAAASVRRTVMLWS